MHLSKSPDLHNAFLRDGCYIHAAPVLEPDLLERAQAGFEDVRLARYDTGEAPAGRLWNPGDDPRKLCKIEQPQLGSHALREALRSPLLGQLAQAVTGARMVQVWWVQLLSKPGTPDAAGAATNVGWHQDLSYWGSWQQGSELFTAWLALSDVSLHSGPMVFVPGSQRWGLLPGGNFFGQDQDALRAAIAIPEGESWREVPVVLPPGGVSFHHHTLFHGSRQNVTERPRRSLAIHMRTEKSAIDPAQGFARYLDRPEICPIIAGS